jgi:GAF domain-containing protein
MSEEITITATARKDRYEELLPQIEALISSEPDLIANLANVCAALKYAMDFFWVGFYLVRENELVLGPFQGPVACTRIGLGKGVCGAAWMQKKTVIVDDVDAFPGHIACNSASKSEIVVPIIKDGSVKGVLDVDSDKPADFSDTDSFFLGKIISMLQFKFAINCNE